ncbi:hypothetical protein FISHEDRAFT_6397, partial [Fistulina hepatica ATCC 64428]
CKRHAPFPLSRETFVDEDGNWCPRRLNAYLNSWNPTISTQLRCNNDIKFLTNGEATKNIAFYVTGYATKPQAKSHNICAMIASALLYHMKRSEEVERYYDSLHDSQRKLLFHMVNAVNRQQEIAMPMVVSYIMGWGDQYTMDLYTSVYWRIFMDALYDAYP